ncbi:hypothetical protein VC83_05856 [Pseudogymnoascus destructans]|uniref:Uncharacterized protein n=2 Tax=Pseudogymnoascus destructans TaxID=655981 RepID=L8G710_PSED2|nr:uncharacterized protein VC83_05856 [Pseudogymnoascus destructans]ELR08912.1 hypothetical protein GMDG_03579 [Pseudogymnoascus destructans 20631-21]OAF57230.2 hypothetical protein VC83_05856 [Pseudogymnoascus destructans]
MSSELHYSSAHASHCNNSISLQRFNSQQDTMAGFVNRENRVPYYQRLFQEGQKNGVRQWNQTARSKILLYPYYTILFGGLAGSMYMMSRMVLGHKTWFGKN